MTKAYSYIRFSSPEQSKGHSLARQMEKASEYATKHELDLDTSVNYADLGRSAWNSSNSVAGMLGTFITAIDTGLVASDSWLLVESLDRLSRDCIMEAQSLIMTIMLKGITIVTLIDGRVLSKEICNKEPFKLIEAIIVLIRANDESTTKSIRGLDNWKRKRVTAGTENKPLTGLTVAWCQLDKQTKTIVVIPERAAIVQGIYKDFLAGIGPELIARGLNIAGVTCWGRGKGEKVAAKWNQSYIRKILLNPAVIGRMTSHTLSRTATKKTRTPQNTMNSYYPAVIDPMTFERVQELLENKGTQGRKVSQEVKNILSFIGRCPVCGGTMTRTNKGANQYLVCVKAKGGAGCINRNVPYGKIEAAILHSVPLLLPAINSDSPERGNIRLQIAKLDKQVKQWRTEINRLLTLVKSGSLDADSVTYVDDDPEEKSFSTVRADIQSLETFIGINTGQIEELEKEYLKNNPRIIDEKFQALLTAIADGRSLAEINACMRGVFSAAVIDYDNKRVLLRFRHRELTLPVDYDVMFKTLHSLPRP